MRRSWVRVIVVGAGLLGAGALALGVAAGSADSYELRVLVWLCAVTAATAAVVLALWAYGLHISGAALRRAHSAIEGRSVPDPDDLSPEELALLAGGPGRLLSVCAFDLFLTGWLGDGAPQVFLGHRAFKEATDGLPPLRRSMVEYAAKTEAVEPNRLAGRVGAPGVVRDMLQDLAARGLCSDTEGLYRARAVQRALALVQRLLIIVVFTEVLMAAGGILVLAPALAVIAYPVGLGATGALAFAVNRWTAEVSPRTAAGQEVLDTARERYRHPTPDGDMTVSRALALRRVAVFGGLGANVSGERYRASRHALPGSRLPSLRGGPIEQFDPVAAWDIVNRYKPAERRPLRVAPEGGAEAEHDSVREWIPAFWEGPERPSEPGFHWRRYQPPAEHA